MLRQWEEFPVGPDSAENSLHVTLSKKGEITIGAKAFARLGKPDLAVLLFDKADSVIGLMPSNKFAKNAYPLHAKLKGGHRIVRAHKFCRHYNIKVDRTTAFNGAHLDEEGVLILDLKATTAIGKPTPLS
ncbi:MAG: hypothetical protein ACKVRN_08200 [Pyrinomonadaceae bacterium]